MGKLFSLIFAQLILLQSFNISLDDYSRINVLMDHASFHQTNFGDSFFDFMVEHYWVDHLKNENEHNEHEDLPFKHEHQTCHHQPAVYASSIANFNLKMQMHIEKSMNFVYKESYSLFVKSSVFQPPKQA